MSLRRRLAIGLVAISAVLILTNVVLSNTFEAYLLDRVDRQLLDVAEQGGRLRGLVRGPGPGPGPGGGAGPASDERAVSEYFIALGQIGSSTYVRVSSMFDGDDDAPTPELNQATITQHITTPAEPAEPFTAPASVGGGSWRLVAHFDDRDGVVTVVGVSLNELHNTVERTRRVQVFGTLAVLGALGLVSWWMLRLGIHPLENMAKTADAIAGGDLSHRVEHPGEETEAGRLGVALNSMLGRIEESFRAQEASEAKVRRFAADASHELRTPLTSIRGYAELWRAGGLRGDEELSDAMRRVEQEAGRMGTLVEELLLLARLDQGRPLQLGPVRLDVIVTDAVHDAQAVEPERVFDVRVDEVTVEGDEPRLRQVIANLLANARDHTPASASVTRVRVRADAQWARLEVSDAGPGMAPDVVSQVFERFYRADQSRARAAGSTGLGLSIVAAIVESHGGTVAATSELGTGSTFTVRLPRQPTSSAEPVHS